MESIDAIKYLENLKEGSFLTVNIPITKDTMQPITAMYVGKDEDGRYEFLDTGEFVLSKDILSRSKITIESKFNEKDAAKIHSRIRKEYEKKQQNSILKYDEINLFNNELIKKYDNDQKGFLGYLLRYKKWKVVGNEIVFPDIKNNIQIKKLLKEYNLDSQKYCNQIQKRTLQDVSIFGLARLEHMLQMEQEKIEKKQKELTQPDKKKNRDIR